MNTQENNKMIAEFMGMTAHHQDKGCMIFMTPQGHNDIVYVNDLEYHTSWDWLMPVVEKIENYLSDNVGKVGYFDECLSSNNLEVRYNAVVEFINEYNKTK